MCSRTTLSSSINKDNQRSDSPGYFTLSSNSDSDTGDCAGDISGEEEQFVRTRQRQHDRSFSQSRNDDNFANSSSSTIVYNFQTLSSISSSKDGDFKANSLSSSQEEMTNFDRHKLYTGNSSSILSSSQHDDNSAPPSPPPRPPPPLSYTSTLPPPVPKKISSHGITSRSHSLHQQRQMNGSVNHNLPRQPSAPPSSRSQENAFQPKSKPLQRVQPLQIQSPSVINVLKQGTHTKQPKVWLSSGECIGSSESTYNSSSEENPFSSIESQTRDDASLFGTAYFVDENSESKKFAEKSFRRTNIPPIPPSPSSSNVSKIEPEQNNSVIRRISKNTQECKEKTNISSNATSDNAFYQFEYQVRHERDDIRLIDKERHGNTSSACTSRSNSPFSESSCRIVDSTSKSKKKSIRLKDKDNNNVNKEASPSQSSPLQNAKRCVLNKVNAFTKSKNKNEKSKSRCEDQNACNTDSQQIKVFFSKELPEPIHSNQRFMEQISERIDENNKIKLEVKKEIKTTRSSTGEYKDRSSQKRELNMEKNASSQTQQQQRKRQTLHSSIYNLIKCYEPDFTRKKSICSTTSDVQGSSCTIDRSRSCSLDRNTLSSIISNTVSARLSQLSIESLERINSWLSNPMDNSDCNAMNNTSSGLLSPQSLSNKEIDILDQCVNDLIEFTQGTLEPNRPDKVSYPRYSIVELVQNSINIEGKSDDLDVPKLSVQQLVDKIEYETYQQSNEIDELNTMVTLTPHQDYEITKGQKCYRIGQDLLNELSWNDNDSQNPTEKKITKLDHVREHNNERDEKKTTHRNNADTTSNDSNININTRQISSTIDEKQGIVSSQFHGDDIKPGSVSNHTIIKETTNHQIVIKSQELTKETERVEKNK